MSATHAKHIELRESDQHGAVVALDASCASSLNACGLVTVAPYGAGTWKLVPVTNQVGAVRIGSLSVIIRPKVPFASVLFMLVYATDPGIAPEEFEGRQDSELVPLVAATLERLAGRALARGVLQGYVEQDDALTVVRGRLRIMDQISRHQGRALPAEVRFDDFQVNIPENRILRTALHRMARFPGVPAELRGRLIQLESQLAGAQLLGANVPLPGWRPSRLNERYLPALRLAALILRHAGLSSEHGTQPVASFVIDMAHTFEAFVTAAVRAVYSNSGSASAGRVIAQFPLFLDTDHRQRIRPDIVHVSSAGTPDAVLDAKYKLMDPTSGASARLSDLYQMLTYCTVLGLDRGTLLYAAPSGGARRSALTVERSGTVLSAFPISVTAPPSDLLREVVSQASSALA